MNTPFWNISYPFKDFLTISSKCGDINNELFQKLKLKSKDMKLNIKQISKFEKISNYIISDNINENTCYLNKKNIWFSGACQYKGKFYYGQNYIDTDIEDELLDSTGIFTCVNSCESEIIIKQDYFGCGILYYFEDENYFLVSNRYHLLLLIIATIGYKLKINMANVAADFYSFTSLFSYNISTEMYMEGIYRLPIKNYINISNKGCIIKQRDDYIEALNGKIDETYEDLLLKSKDEIIENIEAVRKSNIFNKYVVDLSGGADSRVVFAGISNIKDITNNVEIKSVDEKSSNDLDIALKINSIFNYPFYRKDDLNRIPVNVKDSLDMWNSYFMGNYHRMGIGPWHSGQSNYNSIRLSGGMGELYRSGIYKLYGGFIKDSKTTDELVENLINNLKPYFNSVTNYEDKIKNILKYEIDSTNGKTLIDKFSNFYTFNSIRYHFGMRAWEYYHDQPMYFPIMSKSAFKASMLLSIDEKSKDKFMIDITNRLNNLLIYTDYNSERKSANELLSEIRDDNKYYEVDISKIEETKEKWLESQVYNKEAVKQCTSKYLYKGYKEFYDDWRNVDNNIYSEMINIYYEIKNYSSQLDDIFDDEFLQKIYKLKDDKGKMYKIYSKLRSIDEQIKIFYK